MYAVFRSDFRSCLWTPIVPSAQANRTPTRVSTHRGLQSQLTRMGFIIIQQFLNTTALKPGNEASDTSSVISQK